MNNHQSHSDEAINAAIFAADQARAALFCLLQKPILSDTERQAARLAFNVMGNLLKRID